MPLPGGAADKIGNRYENVWTVLHMTDVMAEKVRSIRIEPPGEEGVAAEFWLETEQGREYHQAKRQASGLGKWTTSSLGRAGVLAGFLEHLHDPAGITCVFVSTQAAHPLSELAERARAASGPEEFEAKFLSKELRADFQALCSSWGCDPKAGADRVQAFHWLRHLQVRTVDESTLRQMVETNLDYLVEGDTATTLDVLAQLAINSIHKELTAHDIWQRIESRPGLRRRQWESDPRLLPKVEEVTRRYLDLIAKTAIGGRSIPRIETERILELLRRRASSTRCVLVSGSAGCGKSNVVAEAVRRLQAEGCPVLAFRVDRLDPARSPAAVGLQLDLPGSPAQVLAAVAHGRECALVIDQLDAVSTTSGRSPEFWECVDEIIAQASQHRNMHLILACRDFDLQNDSRFRQLTSGPDAAQRVAVGGLSAEVIREVMTEAGLDAKTLTAQQSSLLAVPLHLSLFLQVAKGPQVDAGRLVSLRDLYDTYWEEKQRVLRARLRRSLAWTEVIGTLCDHMSARQVLHAPAGVLDRYQESADAMTSEHVIAISEGRVQFFHETFFDYAFARRFAAKGGSLLDLLLAEGQHLFRRAQVRQILVYERGGDPERYLADVRALLQNSRVRFHVRTLVFRLLAQLPDPRETEWRLVSELLEEASSPMSRVARAALIGSAPWFRLLDQLGVIRQWVNSEDDQLADRAVVMMRSVMGTESARIAEVLAPFVNRSDAWNNRLRYLMAWGDTDSSREFFALFLHLIDSGTLDDLRAPMAQNSDFWMLLYQVRERHPDWCCEAIGRYLDRRLVLSVSRGQPNPFDEKGGTIASYGFAREVFEASSRAAPWAFIHEVLPFMLRLMELTAPEGEAPRHDPVWQYRFWGHPHDTSRQLLHAMESAFRALAEHDPDALAAMAEQFTLAASPFETVQFLLVRAYAANGAFFADTAVGYLCDLPARLSTGYIEGEHGSVWATHELLEAITPHCSPDSLVRLEQTILDYYPAWERKADARRFRGQSQWVLLDAIDPARRSSRATARSREWQRKLGRESVTQPVAMQVEAVGSPIPEAATEEMPDDSWLGAIARYRQDDEWPRMRRRDGGLAGGAFELAQALERRTKEDPRRFSALMLRFPPDSHPAYYSAVLNGIADAESDVGLSLTVCRHCHGLPGRPAGTAIVRLIGKLAGRNLPDELLEILGWYAREDPHPDREYWRTQTGSGDVYYGGDIIMAGLNSTRGAAAETLARLLFAEPRLVERVKAILDRMVQDPSIAVRSWVAETLVAVLNYDRGYAVTLFLTLCDTEDVLLGTRFAEEFLSWALRTHFGALRPVLIRMLDSECARVAEAGARQACLAGLYIDGAQDLIERCLGGTETQRIGAAQVFAANVDRAQFRQKCLDGLVRFFHDQSDKVQDAAAGCFREIAEAELGDFADLMLEFVQSPAYVKHNGNLLFALHESPFAPPEVICRASERFVEIAGASAGDISQAAAGDAHLLSELVLRAYATAPDEATKGRCLDAIDKLLEIGAYGIDEALRGHDR